MDRPSKNYGSISSPDVNYASSPTDKFNFTCNTVVTNIYTINSTFRGLNDAMKNIGGKKDNHELRNKIHIMQSSTNEIAALTSKEIRKLKSLIKKGDKQQQLQVEKLEENFKEAVERYSSVQNEVANKQKAHLLVTVSIENEENEVGTDEEKQKMLAREMAFDQEMLLERESRIRQIESDVLDVNAIMRDLGTLVHEQGAAIDTIENSIDYAVGNVEEGAQQLLKASRSQNAHRWKLVYLVLILLVITAIVIIFIVVSTKK